MSRQCWTYAQHLVDWWGLCYFYIGRCVEKLRMLDDTYPPLRLLVDQQRRAAKLHKGGCAKNLNGGMVENAKPLLRLLTLLLPSAFVVDYSGFMSR